MLLALITSTLISSSPAPNPLHAVPTYLGESVSEVQCKTTAASWHRQNGRANPRKPHYSFHRTNKTCWGLIYMPIKVSRNVRIPDNLKVALTLLAKQVTQRQCMDIAVAWHRDQGRSVPYPEGYSYYEYFPDAERACFGVTYHKRR